MGSEVVSPDIDIGLEYFIIQTMSLGPCKGANDFYSYPIFLYTCLLRI